MSSRVAKSSLRRPGFRPQGLTRWLLSSGVCALALSMGTAQADKPRRLSLAAVGYQFTSLGVRVGYEMTFWERGVSELFAAGSVGGHSGPDPGYSLLTQFELGYRATSNSRHVAVFLDARLGIGYSPWFRSQGRGDVETVINVLTPTALAGIGLDFGRSAGSGLSLFALAGGQGRADFQTPFAGAGLMLLGLQYQLGRPKPTPPPLPVPAVPSAQAPAFPEDSGGQVPSPVLGPAEPAPPEPPQPAPAPLPPTLPADVPQLPPPPTVPYTPRPGSE